MDQDDYHFKLRISVLGDKGVGKSSLTDQLINATGNLIESDISDELSTKSMNYNYQSNIFRIQYWEIQSHHINSGNFFRYCLGSTASIYIFNCQKKFTFENIEQWIKENEKCEIAIKILIGNKSDANDFKFNKSDAQEIANRYNININDPNQINPIFDFLFQSITSQIPNPPQPHMLLNKGIVLGKKLLNSTKYQLSLCDIATLYE